MYILLEDGMEIKEGDEGFNTHSLKWDNLNEHITGNVFRPDLFPIRRKITRVNDLSIYFDVD